MHKVLPPLQTIFLETVYPNGNIMSDYIPKLLLLGISEEIRAK